MGEKLILCYFRYRVTNLFDVRFWSEVSRMTMGKTWGLDDKLFPPQLDN